MISEKILTVYAPHQLSYGVSSGLFFTYNARNKTVKDGCAWKCRESFHDNWDKRSVYVGFYATNIDENIKKISQFFDRREGPKELNLPDKLKTVIYKTNRDNVIIFELSNFWRGLALRRSLITLLIRLSVVYYKGNFQDSLDSYELTSGEYSDVAGAILYFLQGNVNPTFKGFVKPGGGFCDGFVDIFYNVHQKDLSKYLTK